MADKKFRVAIDGNEANVSNRVGSNTYAYEILIALEKLTQKQNVEVTVLLAAKPLKDLPKTRKGWKYRVAKPAFLWTQLASPIHLFLNRYQYDVYFTPGHYAPRLSAVPYVSSVMDLAFLRFPEQFKQKDAIQLTDWTAYSVKKASKVVTISEFTRQDVIKSYRKDEKDVVVAYPATQIERADISRAEIKKCLLSLGINQPYIVYVGTLQPRKNLIRVIEAFERINRLLSQNKPSPKLRSKYKLKSLKEFDSIQLVLAGKVGWLADELLERIQKSPFKERIVVAGYVDDTTKNALYQGSLGSVLVGLFEGFGIPPLESLAQGSIPVVSNTTSLPEVVGKAGILVNPESVASIAEGLLTVILLTAQERAHFRREGRKQLQQFSWSNSAQTILTALKEVAANH